MLPLSPSQEIVWLHEQVLPGSGAYNFVATMDLRGQLDSVALRRAFAAVLLRHPGLRLELVREPGSTPRQRVRDECAPRLRVEDLSHEPDTEAAFQALVRAEAQLPIDPFDAPLLRWCLVRMGAEQHRIIHVEHHLIHDGHSFAILLHDVFSVYASLLGNKPVVLPAASSYAEHVASQATRDTAADLAYWREELRDAAFDVTLPGLMRTGMGTAPVAGSTADWTSDRREGAQLRQSIDPESAERLRALSRDQGHTPFSTLLTLFAELLSRHSGQGDFTIGTAVGNRPPGHERTVGMFVNTIPLRPRLDRTGPARAATDAVTDTLLRALPHQGLPVQELTRALGLHSAGTDNPLFRVMFSAHDAPLPTLDVPGLDISLYEGFNIGTSRFDLDVVLIPDDRRTVGLRQGPAGMLLVWDYDRARYAEDTIRLLAARFLALVRAYLDIPTAALATLPALAPADVSPETASVTSVGSASPDVPGAREVDATLDPLAGRATGRLAFVSGACQLTDVELSRSVDELVDRLHGAGVREGHPVATVLPRGEHAVVALLACLRARFVYCPLSPGDPPARLAALLRRLAPSLVITTEENRATLPVDGPPVAVLERWNAVRAQPTKTFPEAAYAIHTSGSTGLPKAVLVSRAALAYHARAALDRYHLTAQDRALVFAQPSFDVSLEEILPPLLAGGCLVAPRPEVPTGPELVALLAARQITMANLPTSYTLAIRNELCDVLRDGRWRPRLIVLGGERLAAKTLRPLLDATAAIDVGTAICNAYGVTEAAITSTVHEVRQGEGNGDDGDVPLGIELSGTDVYVLGATQCPLPSGAVGELAIAGPGLAQGYLDDEEETATRFVELDPLDGTRVYRTGDQGYRDADGRIRFLGREDNQIKLRGYRIELEEIEAVATSAGLPCAVVLDRDEDGAPRLTGFVATAEDLELDELRAILLARLPAALIPARWIRLDALPVLPGGKPDRRALVQAAGEKRQVDSPPDSGTATGGDQAVAWLAKGWRSVLGHENFSASSHFFQIGGHSMMAAQLASWLEPVLGRRPSLRLLFRHPVLADQARVLRETGA
ncbi:amino acid adenylation domain-containing protein [Streptomyces sp. NPDC059076]|uniref:non-ribosomal peptide synthetase n=1 Tax=unclassified Streptomyces TaxID=2593676 RepID=UPI003677F533